MPNIGNDAHHAPASILRYALANRVLTRPERTRESLIHNDNRFARRAVTLSEYSSGLEADANGLEVSVAHYADERLRMIVLWIDLPFAGHLPPAIPSERQNIDETGRLNTGERACSLQHLIDVRVLARQIRNAEAGVDPQRGRPLRLKSQILIEDAQETAHEEPRADQQGAGKGNLGDYQSVAHPGMPSTAARSAAGVFQHFSDRETRHLQGR